MNNKVGVIFFFQTEKISVCLFVCSFQGFERNHRDHRVARVVCQIFKRISRRPNTAQRTSQPPEFFFSRKPRLDLKPTCCLGSGGPVREKIGHDVGADGCYGHGAARSGILHSADQSSCVARCLFCSYTGGMYVWHGMDRSKFQTHERKRLKTDQPAQKPVMPRK